MSRKTGFTLLELLVVLAIIGILASVTLATLNSARGKADVSSTRAELNQFTKAFALFYAEHQDYPPLPVGTDSFNMGWFMPMPEYQWRTGATPEEDWDEVIDFLEADGFLRGNNARRDAWGNPYLYDKNYNLGPYTCTTWSPVCSMGPNQILETYNCQPAGTPPVTGGDDICVFIPDIR